MKVIYTGFALAALIFGASGSAMAFTQDMGWNSSTMLVGQPTFGGPVHLHGVVNAIDVKSHRIDITDLSGLEVFWQKATHNISVDESVDLAQLRQGERISFVVTRDLSGQYYVRTLEVRESSAEES